MNEKMLVIGGIVGRYLMDTLSKDYLFSVFSEDMGIVDLVDQVLVELIRYAYDHKEDRHSTRYYGEQQGDYTDAERMRLDRRVEDYNEYTEKDIALLKGTLNVPVDENAKIAKLEKIEDKKEGRQLTPLEFEKLNSIYDLRYIRAVEKNRFDKAGKISYSDFGDMAREYDKRIITYIEKSKNSDKDMVLYSLAYIECETYAFDFLYTCADYMTKKEISDPAEFFARIKNLLGEKITYPFWGGSVISNSRMVGLRERLIPMFIEDETYATRYNEIMTLVTQVTEVGKMNGIPLGQWFLENTDVNDWASFFKEYNVFKYRKEKKEYDNRKIIKYMKGLIKQMFCNDRKENAKNPEAFIRNEKTLAQKVYDEIIMLSTIKCYIEEYYNSAGALCARIRDKDTNKRIIIDADVYMHFMRFLSSAKRHMDIMPTLYEKDGNDAVVVRGGIKSENDDSIEVSIGGLGAGYWFQ